MFVKSAAMLAAISLAIASAQAQIAVTSPASDADVSQGITVTVDESGNATVKQVPLATRAFMLPVMGKYWLGVHCYPASATLRAQLGLAEDQGLVVSHVMKDSPAMKAGLEQHDVLLSIGDEKLANQMQLAKALEKHGDKKISLTYLRAGKKKSMELEPAPRKAAGVRSDVHVPGLDVDRKAIEKFLEEVIRAKVRPRASAPLKMRAFGPGVVVEHGAARLGAAKMPKGLKVIMTKDGDNPAKIRVTQGDKTWEIEEGQWDKLPKELRPHVRRITGAGSPATATIRGFGLDRAKATPSEIKDLNVRIEKLLPKRDGGPTRSDLYEFQMQQMNERLEQMQNDIDRLLKNSTPDKE